MYDNYTPLPIIFSEDDNEWLLNIVQGNGYLRSNNDYIRCDCHDAFWHYSELHVVPVDDNHDLLICDAPWEVAK